MIAPHPIAGRVDQLGIVHNGPALLGLAAISVGLQNAGVDILVIIPVALQMLLIGLERVIQR